MSHLPTREEMFARADAALAKAALAVEDARAELLSDWTPIGSSLTDAQALMRKDLFVAISTATRAIEEARHR